MTKFSILGYGHIGRVHRDAIEKADNAELVSIIDIDYNEEKTGIMTWQSLDDFLANDKETEVVIIATPNGFHAEHAIKCMEAGKHVLIEKPLALTMEDANEIIRAGERYGKRVFSSMQLRFAPPVSYVKNLLENKLLGKVYMVNIQCYWNRNRDYYLKRKWHGNLDMDGGVLFTQFSHFIDIMNYWFEDVECIQSHFYNFNHQGVTEFPDSGKVDFIADGANGNMIFTTSTFEKNFKSHITLIAEKGTLEIGDQYLNQMNFINLGDREIPEGLSTDIRNFHPIAIAEIADALNENRPSVLDGEHAVRLVKFIEEAHKLSGEKIWEV